MKISEYNVFEENKHIKENIHFPAVQNNITSKETYLQNIESLKTNEENILQKQGKVTQNTDNKNVVKKLLQKVTEATSSLIGNVAVTAVVAVTSVIVFTSILIKAPNIELLDLITGYDYVSYNLYIDETSEDMDYYVTISSNFENYRYELDDGENIGRVDNLRHNMEYELSVIGIGKSDNQEVKYFETKFYTTVSIKIISVKWIVDGITVEEDQIEEGVTPIYDGSIPKKNSTNELNYTFLQWNESIDENGNITYIAQFSSSTRLYNVKWIVEDIIVKEDEIEYGKTPSYDGVTPVKSSTNEYNYTFLQWNESTDENGNITYIAEFTQTTRLYNVTWVVEGVTFDEVQIEYGQTPVYNGETPIKPSTNEYNYTFLEWNESTDENGNITYIAEFTQTIRLYNVTWVVEGVTFDEGQIEYGQSPVYNGETPFKPSTNEYNYTFLEWNESTDENGNITYIAEFTQTTRLYNVAWVVDGITVEEDQIEYGQTPIYNGSTPLKSSTDELDFTFLQWNETTDEIGNFTYVAEFISTVRLYTVTWIVEGVTVEEDQIEYGQIPVFDGATPTKEMTIDEEYTFIGWDNNLTNVTTDITYTAVFETIIHEYTATFVVPTQSNITINYDNPDYYVISLNTEFDNTTDARLLYRIILTDVQTNTQYIYEGTDSIATIDVLSTVKDMTITYELVGIYNGMEKLYEVVELTEHIAISNITSQIIDDYQLIGIDSYEFKMIINSDYSNEEVYNYIELVINYDDLSQQEILLEDVVVNEEMSIFIEVPSFCGSFTIDYRISLLDRYGQSERIIEESTEITLESIYELTNVYIDSRQFMTARLDFIYHLTDENTTIAVKDSTSGEVATLTEGYDYIEISINSTAQDLTYYLSNINNEVLDTETIISFDSANITGDYSFNYVNPGDAIVTFNDDGTMNIYLDTLFETEDQDIYYLIRYNDFNSESIYEIKYTDSVAVIENIPFSNYGIVYYVYKTVEGIDYQLEYIAVSGGVEITYDSVVSGYTQIDNNNNLGLYLSFSEYSNVNLDSFVLLIDQEEIIISSSDFVLTDGTYEFTYILEQEPSKLQVQYEATYNNETIYESVLLSGKIKGEQYRIMYCSVIE